MLSNKHDFRELATLADQLRVEKLHYDPKGDSYTVYYLDWETDELKTKTIKGEK